MGSKFFSKLTAGLFLLSVYFTSTAQDYFQAHNISPKEFQEKGARCFTDQIYQKHLQEFPELKQQRDQLEADIQQYLQSNSGRMAGTVLKIPMVVHIIHTNGSENITDAQVQSQITVLNQDYRKTGAGNGLGVDTEIEFCLATKTPTGSSTTGITRTYSTLTDHYMSQESQLKALIQWDPSKYLNIWIVKEITDDVNGGGSGILGYATFPGGASNLDGVVIDNNNFGTSGTVSYPFDKGRTATHEVGHWINLYHTFQDGCYNASCSSNGDRVCDTPPVYSPNYGCTTRNSCNTDSPDVNDYIDDYMDYTDDACMSRFTQGQKDRVRAALATYRSNLYSDANLTATGCGSGGTTTSGTLTIGTGTSTSGSTPYATYYMDHRAQFIITNAELVAGGWTSANNVLKSLSFDVATVNSLAMNSFTIKISHTTATSFGTSFLTGTGTTTVYTANYTAISGWNKHTFSTAFTYNGTSNLLIDICFNNSTYTSDSQVRYTATSSYRTLYLRQDISSGGVCSNTTGTQTYDRPNMQLEFGAGSVSTQSTLTVGTGTSTSGNTPYGTYYMDHRAQFIITNAELVAGGWTSANNVLKSLSFDVATVNSLAMNSFTIKISHTTATSFGTSFLTGTGTTTVYTANYTAVSGWNKHTFSTAFTYDGTSNLLIDICFNNSTYTSDSQVRYTATSSYRTLYLRQDISSGEVCSNTTGTQTYNRPNMQLEFGAGSVSTQSTLTVGSGTGSTGVAPYGTYYMDERCQFIITKSELDAAGKKSTENVLKSLAFNVASASGQVMNGFTIKISHTTATSFGTSFLTGTGTATVYTANYTAATGWNTHTFSTKFNYDGTSNLLIDICFNNSSYTTNSTCYYTATSSYRTLYKKQDVSSGGICSTTSGTQSYNRANMKLVFASSTSAREENEISVGSELPQNIDLKLYPNPSSGVLNISYNVPDENATVLINMYDLKGVLIGNIMEGNSIGGEHLYSIDLNYNSRFANLPNGMYLCTIFMNGNKETRQFILAR